MRVELVKQFKMEIAHRGASGDLHGHSLDVNVVCAGDTAPPEDWLVDYAEISAAFEPTFDALDHRIANDALQSDCVTIADIGAWIESRLRVALPSLHAVHTSIVGDGMFRPFTLSEESSLNLSQRLRFTVEAAHALPNLPEGHKCRRMHGHSFRIEVAAPNLEVLMPALKPIYDATDRFCLNDIAGLENPTSEVFAHWIWNRLDGEVEQLGSVGVAETCTARCIYRGE